MKKNFTIEDIDEMLMRENKYWVLRLVYHPKTNSYKDAKMKDFDTQTTLLVTKSGTNFHQHLKLEVDDEKFVYEVLGKKTDASEAWQQVLGKTQQL